MYINTETLESPLTLRQVRQAVPNVSLPKQPDETTLNALGFAKVQPVERPAGDVVTESTPAQQADGTWQQTWGVRDYTPEEIEQRRLASVPQSITPRQARLALLNAGLLSQTETAVEALESPAKEQVKIEWEYATSVERDSEWINQLGGALGLDSAGIDDLFVQASQL